jgi:methylated-DNA-protein-cysteine methyltransferase-like protein
MARQAQQDFYETIYQVVELIPPGRVTSYGAIAAFLGQRGGARLVGYALTAANKQGRRIPAHRVVNRNGQLTGKAHFPPPGMQALLAQEGVPVEDDQVQDFAERFWDPAVALGW